MYRKLIFFTVCALTRLTGFSQQSVLAELSSRFQNYNAQVFSEKVFVHIDKPGYTAGETIWFKVYNIEGNTNRPVAISKIVYTELLNSKNEPVLQGKIALESGSGSGSFYLPFGLPSGNYRFRAYTSWMKNFSPDYFFEQPVLVVNPLLSAPSQSDSSINQATLYAGIFPEGGNLVSGIATRCGVKVNDRSGKGTAFTGAVINQRNDTMARFRSFKFGMGSFDFTPAPGDQYRALIRTEAGENTEAAFPAVAADGVVMNLTEEKTQLKLTVHASGSYTGQNVYLLVHTRQQLKKAEMRAIQPNGIDIYIAKTELAEGISQLTLFNQDKQPLCERLFFIAPAEKLLIDAQAGAGTFDTRSKAVVQLFNHDAGGRPLKADLSMGVYKVDAFYDEEPLSIASYLWLSADLPGYIESPRFYFGTGEDAATARNNLMLTQGWRKFKWADVNAGKLPVFYFLPEYEGHIIDGKVISRKTGLPVANLPVFVSPVGSKNAFGSALTTQDGYFLTVVKDFYGARDVVLQTSSKDDSYQFALGNPFLPEYSTKRFPLLNITTGDGDQVLDAGIASQAQNIYRKDSLQRFRSFQVTDSTAFYGTPDGRYYLDSYTRFNTMEEVMREYISGVSVRKQSGKFHFRVNNQPREQYFTGDPLVLLDGVPVFEVDRIATHDPLKVRKIEVMNRQYLMNSMSWPGIVSYTSYKQQLDGFKLDPSALVVNYDGLQLQREFYAPAYETAEQKASRMPDFRTQLFWTADTRQTGEGRAQVEFYTSDLEGKFAGVVQGITMNGEAGMKVFYFEVKKR